MTAKGLTTIGEWVLDRPNNELRRGSEAVRLEPKVIEVLSVLAESAGTAVSRESLLAEVWPGVIVGDDALTQAIIKLRKALGDDAHQPRYIETISKRGYRLIAPVGNPTAAPAVVGPPGKKKGAVIAIVTALALIGVVALSGLVRMPWPLQADSRGASVAAIPTIAVLPFANLSGDPRREYLSDGITEDIINALGRFSGIRVMSRNAVQVFKGRAVTPQAIRTELGARYIAQGSVRASDGRLRVAIELSDAGTGAQLWSEKYDGEGSQLFEMQDRIVRDVAGKLQVKLTDLERQRSSAKPIESLEAYDLVLRARHLLANPDRAANREARSLLTRASQLAPDSGDVQAALAAAAFQRATDGFVEDAVEATRQAEEHARRALSSPDARSHAIAHTQLAAIYTHQTRYEDALAQSERAIELNPSDAAALYWRGGSLLGVGRIDDAIAVLETARRYEPYPAPGRGINLSIAYFVAGRYSAALQQTDALLARNPRNGFLHAMRAACLAELGKREDAARAAADVRRFNPVFDADNFGTRFADPKYSLMVREGLRKAGL